MTPGYYTRRKNREFLPINHLTIYTIEEEEIRPLEGETVKVADGNTYSWSGLVDARALFTMKPDYVLDPSDVDHVVIKALNKAKAPEWDALTFLGEFPKTVDLFKKKINDVYRLGRRLKERAKRTERKNARKQRRSYSAKRAIQLFNKYWLEARYAWRPMVYDVQNMLAAYRKTRGAGSQEVASSKHTVDLHQIETNTVTYTDSRYVTTRTRVGDAIYRAKVYYIDNMESWGANPVISAWQLTRFSFIVDWFVDVSSWLQAICPRSGYVELGVVASCRINTSDTYEIVHEGLNGWTSVGTPAEFARRVNKHQRDEYTSIPLPQLNVRLDPFKIIDLLAIISSGARDVMDMTD